MNIRTRDLVHILQAIGTARQPLRDDSCCCIAGRGGDGGVYQNLVAAVLVQEEPLGLVVVR